MTVAPDVGLTIDQKDFRYWEEIEIRLSLDNFSTIELSAPFEPDSQDPAAARAFKETFVPFSYKPIEVKVDGALLFTGQLVGVEPRVTPKSRTVRCSGYSLPAQLMDTTPPASEFPIEYGDHTLLQIAINLVRPFDVVVVVQAGTEMGAKFRKVRIKPNDKIGQFLIKLAQARGVLMRDTALGELMFLKAADVGRPVAVFKEGEQPMTSCAATFSPQAYYSEITGLARTKAGRKGGKGYTESNEHLPKVVRPLNFVVGDVNAGDLPNATKAKMARMFGNMVSYVVEVPTWHDPSGNLWAPNTTVTLEAPGAMVYSPVELLVRDVILRAKADSVTASLGLVLPGAFTGVSPETLPWD